MNSQLLQYMHRVKSATPGAEFCCLFVTQIFLQGPAHHSSCGCSVAVMVCGCPS